jgi:hypothetical protein
VAVWSRPPKETPETGKVNEMDNRESGKSNCSVYSKAKISITGRGGREPL